MSGDPYPPDVVAAAETIVRMAAGSPPATVPQHVEHVAAAITGAIMRLDAELQRTLAELVSLGVDTDALRSTTAGALRTVAERVEARPPLD